MYYYLFHYGMPIITFIHETYNYLYNEVLDIMKIDNIFFFENNPTGYLEAFVNNDNPNNGTVVWKYSRSKKLFYQYKCIRKDTKHLPILSASLECESVTINLDEFINDIHIETSNYGYPTLQHILEVWSYHTHIILDRTKLWKLNYMDLNLNVVKLDVFNETWDFTKNNKN